MGRLKTANRVFNICKYQLFYGLQGDNYSQLFINKLFVETLAGIQGEYHFVIVPQF